MGKIVDKLWDAFFWVMNLYSGLKRDRHDDPITARWKSYQKNIWNSFFAIVAFLLVTCIFGLWPSNAADAGNLSAISEMLESFKDIVWVILGAGLITWHVGAFAYFWHLCRKHDLPMM